MGFYVAQLLTGLANASSLFLIACGLSIIFGVTRSCGTPIVPAPCPRAPRPARPGPAAPCSWPNRKFCLGKPNRGKQGSERGETRC